MKKYLFVINPIAGKKRKINIEEKINRYFTGKAIFEFLVWESANFDITKAVSEKIKITNYDAVVAVGGDGTINAVAKELINTGIPFGIIPLGSGNGLARHLRIPLNFDLALETISRGKTALIDSCKLNEKPFFCTAGAGFDAHIGKLFSATIKRGFLSYIKIVWNEFNKYKPKKYLLQFNNNELTREAFLITVANGGQYGNNAYISPQSDISDGYFDIIILKKFNLFFSPLLVIRLFTKTFHKSKFVECYKAKELSIICAEKNVAHFDGEPFDFTQKLVFSVIPNSIKVIN